MTPELLEEIKQVKKTTNDMWIRFERRLETIRAMTSAGYIEVADLITGMDEELKTLRAENTALIKDRDKEHQRYKDLANAVELASRGELVEIKCKMMAGESSSIHIPRAVSEIYKRKADVLARVAKDQEEERKRHG